MQTRSFTRQALALSLGLLLVAPAPLAAFAEDTPKTLRGSVIQSEHTENNPSINPDDLKEVTPGTQLDMVVSTALESGVNAEGDEFFGKTSKDYVVDGKVVIPRGTLVHGAITKMEDRKRAGRNGWMATKFDYMITPDGREIPITGGNSTRDNKFKAGAKIVGRASGYTAVGGVVGALMVLKYAGLGAVVASNGYALAGGAAVGGTIGLTAAMVKKGHSAVIAPGSEIRVRLAEPLTLPTMNMPDAAADNFSIPGLTVNVLGMRYDKDPFGEQDEVTLSLDITNTTENTFTTFDIGLEDEFGNVFYPSPFGDTGMWFKKLTPNSKAVANVTFGIDSSKRLHKLVFYKQYTREPLAKVAITDKIKELDKKAQKNVKNSSGKKVSNAEQSMF